MGLFDWFKRKETIDYNDITREQARRPAVRDWTDDLTVNRELTKGLYHNSYPGMKLAGGLAFTPIAVPVWLMGLPVPSPIDEGDTRALEDLKIITDMFRTQTKQVNLQCHRDGTIWVWPKWSSAESKLIWEFIPDNSVVDIVKDIESGEVKEVIVDEQIAIKLKENTVAYVRRKRYFTKTRITEMWLDGKSQVPKELKDVTYRNIIGILPIPFSNNNDAEEIRGYTDYERFVTNLKSYHDIKLQRNNMLAKFQPKMIQHVQDPKTWKANNGYTSIADIKVYDVDFIINLYDQEKTEFQSLDAGAYSAYREALIQEFQTIVEASGIPEIFWGLKTSGNHASVEESMAAAVKYITDKQEQKTSKYVKLFFASLALYRIATVGGKPVPVKVEWNDLDAVSDSTKAVIFKEFSAGLSTLVKSASITKEQTYLLWKQLYPRATQQEYDKFILGLSDMAQHVQYTNASYSETLDFNPQETQGEDEE